MSPEQHLTCCLPEGEHLIWPGTVGSGQIPVAMMYGRKVSLRREVYKYYRSMPTLDATMVVIQTCGHPRCLAEKCLQAFPKRGLFGYKAPQVSPKPIRSIFEMA